MNINITITGYEGQGVPIIATLLYNTIKDLEIPGNIIINEEVLISDQETFTKYLKKLKEILCAVPSNITTTIAVYRMQKCFNGDVVEKYNIKEDHLFLRLEPK